MEYLQIKNGEAIQVTTQGNVEWSPNHFCPASKLTPEEASLFDVYPLLVTEPPVINPVTQSVVRDGCELVDGTWQYRWRIDDLSAEQIAIKRQAIRTQQWERIKTERDRRKSLGVKFDAHWYHSDADSRIQQLSLFVMGSNVPPVQWKTLTASGAPVFVTMTQSIAAGIFQGTAASDAAVFAAAESHRVSMEASSTPETYDFSGGWPVAFGDAP